MTIVAQMCYFESARRGVKPEGVSLALCTTRVYHRFMPSPRFSRLPPERRSKILAVAREHLARDGIEGASYNQIIANAEISKTTAYMYFDGKRDLAAEVVRDVYARLGEVMGPWRATESSDLFWEQLAVTSDALRRHLLAHPDDLALLAQPETVGVSELDVWFGQMLDDGIALGVIRTDVERPLLLAATVALFRVIDEWELAALSCGESIDPAPAWRLLRGLWASPSSSRAGVAPVPGAELPSP
ncbi:MAG: TetR/AcrR family transcriptional regulator [Actinobacteria bacterium]|nr:TetR/AcrR family transcriptional regulator [Actinomycetota bacterium]